MDKSVENRLMNLGLIEIKWPEIVKYEEYEYKKMYQQEYLGNFVSKPEVYCSTYRLSRDINYYEGYFKEDKEFCPGEVKHVVRHKEGDIYLCERCFLSYTDRKADSRVTGYRYYVYNEDDKDNSSIKRYIDVHRGDIEGHEDV